MKLIAMFEYSEDLVFFDGLLSEIGGVSAWQHLFDDRDPAKKRREFGRFRNLVFEKLIEKVGNICQLRCHEDCINKAEEVDHLVPLKTNVLNKELRALSGIGGKKVPSLSYGSNDPANLILSCKRCNAFKKHRMPSKETITRILLESRII